MERCPKCNSSLIKHIKGTTMSKDGKLYTTTGLCVFGSAVGTFFGPAGVVTGAALGKAVGELISNAGEDEHNECLSCGYKF